MAESTGTAPAPERGPVSDETIFAPKPVRVIIDGPLDYSKLPEWKRLAEQGYAMGPVVALELITEIMRLREGEEEGEEDSDGDRPDN